MGFKKLFCPSLYVVVVAAIVTRSASGLPGPGTGWQVAAVALSLCFRVDPRLIFSNSFRLPAYKERAYFCSQSPIRLLLMDDWILCRFAQIA